MTCSAYSHAIRDHRVRNRLAFRCSIGSGLRSLGKERRLTFPSQRLITEPKARSDTGMARTYSTLDLVDSLRSLSNAAEMTLSLETDPDMVC